ncbi:MAG: SidJ-related pseudokinase [Desulfobacterales bacterium]|nr:SidJ-related pseudokinase [Desulfobacterales bacterium]
MAVQYLATHIRDYPEDVTSQTVEALASVVESDRFASRKQILFLYGEAADTLVLLAGRRHLSHSRPIISRLRDLLPSSSGKRLRAVSQALGKLPVHIQRPDVQIGKHIVPEPRSISLNELTSRLGHHGNTSFTWSGRSLMLMNNGNPSGVIKFARSRGNVQELLREAEWLAYLAGPDETFSVPTPVSIGGCRLFKVNPPLPSGAPEDLYQGICIAFTPCEGYYEYPNENNTGKSIEPVMSIFRKNARQLGALTAKGIVHTALIPLFHNRVQQGRRNDNGAYLWEHGGRLDQWLDSCRYPNFARSGLRDFEHMIQTESGKDLRHYIGEHLLSFILVMGSCFRSQAPDRRGKDENQCPADTRDLFCPDLFQTLIQDVCRAYFQGLFQGASFPPLPLSNRELVDELIQFMGRDENMEEMLRVRDQNDMSDTVFERFLRRRGVSDIPAKGADDIILETGPHLGGFNQTISTPKLIDFLFRYSAICVAFWFENQAEEI